jgi:hypothetical protein
MYIRDLGQHLPSACVPSSRHGSSFNTALLNGKLETVKGLGLEAPREQKICENLQVNALYAFSSDRNGLHNSLTTLNTLCFDKAKTEKISQNLISSHVICSATKTGAKTLLAAATTPQEKSVAIHALAKANPTRKLDVLLEEEIAEAVFVEVLEFMPTMATHTRDTVGQQWFQSIAPEKGARVCLSYWLNELTMPVVYERLNYCYQLGDPGFQHLITQFRGALKAYRRARDTRDTSDSADTPPKTRIYRSYSASEKEQLRLLLNAGKLDTHGGRASAAVALSKNSGIETTGKHVHSWSKNFRRKK